MVCHVLRNVHLVVRRCGRGRIFRGSVDGCVITLNVGLKVGGKTADQMYACRCIGLTEFIVGGRYAYHTGLLGDDYIFPNSTAKVTCTHREPTLVDCSVLRYVHIIISRTCCRRLICGCTENISAFINEFNDISCAGLNGDGHRVVAVINCSCCRCQLHHNAFLCNVGSTDKAG